MRIAIITPTYRRIAFLKRFIRQVLRQDYDDWILIIVHDGEDQQTQQVVENFIQKDPRIYFAYTKRRGNDFGVTPRLLGVKLVGNCNLADYIVFWDDDNKFYHSALSSIVKSLYTEGMPGVLLMPILYGNYILPQDLEIEQMKVCSLDMSNFVIQTTLVAELYEQVLWHSISVDSLYEQDFFLFEALRRKLGPSGIRRADCPPIGRYDGLRLIENIRCTLRFHRLGMKRFTWYCRLRQRL
jgi:rhamnosyltransferase